LISWYAKLVSCVKWGESLSEFFPIKRGVRQGGILSPILFSIYMDDLLNRLKDSGLGCFISGECCNSLMYADDLILVAISLCDMQKMVNMCLGVLEDVEMMINGSKTVGIRIGGRFDEKTENIVIGRDKIEWKGEIKYLGVSIIAGKNFKVNPQRLKQKYFGAVNSIYGKVGTLSSPRVLCSLISTFCVPIILYGAEAIAWNLKSLKSIDFSYSCAISKIIKTFEKREVKRFLCDMGYLPLSMLIDLRKLTFLDKLKKLKDNMLCSRLMFDDKDTDIICGKYNLVLGNDPHRWKDHLFNHFISDIEDLVGQ